MRLRQAVLLASALAAIAIAGLAYWAAEDRLARPRHFSKKVPSLAGATGVLIPVLEHEEPISAPEGHGGPHPWYYEGEFIWLSGPGEIRAFRASAFAEPPIPDAGYRWERYGDTQMAMNVFDRNNGGLEIFYCEARPGLVSRVLDMLRGPGSYIQICGERRYFPVGDKWRNFLSNTVASHPHLHAFRVEHIPDVPLDTVVGTAHRIGLPAQFALWSSKPWHGPQGPAPGAVELFFVTVPDTGKLKSLAPVLRADCLNNEKRNRMDER